jgi:hypothetical protein
MDATTRSPTRATSPRTTTEHRPTGGAPAQLRLLSGAPWHLNESTREIGRQGVASAREALRSARQAANTQRHTSSSAAA